MTQDAPRVQSDLPASAPSRLRVAAAIAFCVPPPALFVAFLVTGTAPFAYAFVVSLVVLGAFGDVVRRYDRRRAQREPVAGLLTPVVHPELRQDEAAAFWARPHARLTWLLLSTFEAAGLFGGLVAGVVLGGDNPGVALLIVLLAVVVVGLVSWWLHVRTGMPVLTALPARPEPDAHDVPATVAYRPSVATAAAIPLALAFVGGLFGAIVVSEGRPGSAATAVIVTTLGLGAVGCGALFLGLRRLCLDVRRDGVAVTNPLTRHVVPWPEIARVEATNEWWLFAVVAAAATTSDTLAETPIPFPRGVRLRLQDGRGIKVAAVLCADPNRNRRLQEALVALRRDAREHGVQVDY
jgi:hypothetical protein